VDQGVQGVADVRGGEFGLEQRDATAQFIGDEAGIGFLMIVGGFGKWHRISKKDAW